MDCASGHDFAAVRALDQLQCKSGVADRKFILADDVMLDAATDIQLAQILGGILVGCLLQQCFGFVVACQNILLSPCRDITLARWLSAAPNSYGFGESWLRMAAIAASGGARARLMSPIPYRLRR